MLKTRADRIRWRLTLWVIGLCVKLRWRPRWLLRLVLPRHINLMDWYIERIVRIGPEDTQLIEGHRIRLTTTLPEYVQPCTITIHADRKDLEKELKTDD